MIQAGFGMVSCRFRELGGKVGFRVVSVMENVVLRLYVMLAADLGLRNNWRLEVGF